MIEIVRTTHENPDFIELVRQLNQYLTVVDGDDHAFYDQYNHIDTLPYILVAYDEGQAVGCGAIKPYDSNTMEVKRMYTLPKSRGKGIASYILSELENWAAELGADKCILETGKGQIEAVHFYPKNGYRVIENFGQYAGVENSVCFEKFV